MRSLIGASLALAFAVAPAGAEHRYDRKLEEAAMRIVAENIGSTRGGFSYRQKPRFVVAQDAPPLNAGSLQKPDPAVSPLVVPSNRPKS